MTVNELMVILEQMDGDKPVYIRDRNDYSENDPDGYEHLTIVKEKNIPLHLKPLERERRYASGVLLDW